MGHYDDLYAADEAERLRESKLKETKTLANDVAVTIGALRDLHSRLQKHGYHMLAHERLQEIVDDLKAHQQSEAFKADPKARDIAIAITHIETAILWLKK